MSKIVELSKNKDRPEIAKELNISKVTVWQYQKMFKLI
jgi:DNA-binding CsgD family transcriptional regulator